MLVALVCLGALAGPATAAQASVQGPSLSMSASPAAITNGGTTRVFFTVDNFNASPQTLSNITFTLALPAGLRLATGSGGTAATSPIYGSCSGQGTTTADPSNQSISLTGADLGGECGFGFYVTATTPGSKTLTTSAVTATEATSPGAPATLAIDILGPPTLAMAFSPSSVLMGTQSTLTYTITDANSVDQTGVAFSDSLPMGLTVANPANLANTCGGTVTANAGSSSVSLSGGTAPASANCTISVSLVAGSAGTLVNTTGSVSSSNGGVGATATANLLVVQAPTLAAGFANPSIIVGGATTTTFTVHNPNTGALSGLAFSDTLPAGLAVASSPAAGGTCNGTTTATAGSSSIALSGATLAGGGTCTVIVPITATAAGAQSNVTGPISSTQSGTNATANASINVFTAPTVSASFGTASLALGATTSLSLTITNPAANPASLHGVAVGATLPSGLVVATPNGLTGSCGGGTITAGAGGTMLSLSGATLSAGASCTFSISVLATAVGPQSLVTGNVGSTEGGTGGTASASLVVAVAPSLQIAFAPSSIAAGGTSTLTFTVSNTNNANLTGVAFTDTLPSDLTISSPGLSGSCGGGTITASVGTNAIALSSATIAGHANCSFSVPVTATALGTQTNTTSSVTSSNGGSSSGPSAALRVLAPPTVGLAFASASAATGAPTALIFTLHNPNNSALTGAGVSDALPSGLTVASPNGETDNCSGANVSDSPGSSSIALSGAGLPASGSCSFSVNVVASAPGSYSTTSSAVTSAETGPGPTAGASITVFSPPAIAMAFGAPSIVSGSSTTLSFTVTSPAGNPGDLHGVGFSEQLPAGLIVSTPSALNQNCGGGSISALDASDQIELQGAALASGQACTFSISVTATAGGQQDTTTGHVHSDEGGDGATASATIDVPQPPSITAAFATPSVAVGAITSISFTLANPNPIALTGVAFTDTLPAGVVLVALKPVTEACGGTLSAVAGAASIALTDATLAANASCTFSLFITGQTTGVKDNSTSTIDSIEAGTGNPSGGRLTVVAATVTTTPTATTPAPPPPPKVVKPKPKKVKKLYCVVPALKGRTLAQARTLLTHGNCKLGKIRHKRARAAKLGHITAQAVKAGAKHASGYHVGVTLAK